MRQRRLVLLATIAAAGSVPVAAHAWVTGPTDPASVGPTTAPLADRVLGGLSSDGQLVALQAGGADLDPTDANGASDAFVTTRGTRVFERVSRPSADGASNGHSTLRGGAISADGNRVAFTSAATNLADNDANLRTDVFVYDRSEGRTRVISRGPTGFEADGRSHDATISADGGVVAFVSNAPNLTIPPDLNGHDDVFVRDLETGRIESASVSTAGLPADGPSSAPQLSADGTKVAFLSAATNLVEGDTNGRQDVFVRDLTTGRTTRASLGTDGRQANGIAVDPALSADGGTVAWATQASNLGGLKYAGTKSYDVFVRDLERGVTERVLTERGLEHGRGNLLAPSLSGDGRLLSFVTSAQDTFGQDGSYSDVYVLDRATDELRLVSAAPNGAGANGSSAESELSDAGTAIAFRSSATNLSPLSAGSRGLQVFVRSLDELAVLGDRDSDGAGDLADVCPQEPDAEQADLDGDGRGNACDADADSDAVLGDLEDDQGSDPFKADSDGDGAGDLADDFPADGDLQLGTSHRTLSVATFDVGAEAPVQVEIAYDPAANRFRVRADGVLPSGSTSLPLHVFRRADGIRNQSLCTLRRTNASSRAASCSAELRLAWFTHVAVRHAGRTQHQEPERPLTDAE